jgi:hypothetical protein
MVYIFDGPAGSQNDEPAAIDMRLAVAEREYAPTNRELNYWPRFDSLTAGQRRYYLNWLSKRRTSIPIELGYVARGGSVPGAFEPEDFAKQAIEKALDGRSWNRDVYHTLEGFLRSIVDSDISHLVESIDNAKGRRLASPSSKSEAATAYEVPGTEPNPLHVVIDADSGEHFRAAAIRELNGDKFLIELFECLRAEIVLPAEIAQYLGICGAARTILPGTSSMDSCSTDSDAVHFQTAFTISFACPRLQLTATKSSMFTSVSRNRRFSCWISPARKRLNSSRLHPTRQVWLRCRSGTNRRW